MGLDFFTALEPRVAADLPRVAMGQPLAAADRRPLVPVEEKLVGALNGSVSPVVGQHPMHNSRVDILDTAGRPADKVGNA